MKVILGIDLGTTKIATVAFDVEANCVLAHQEEASHAESHAEAGRSEWSPNAVITTACRCIRRLTSSLPDEVKVEGVVVTGQQHSSLLMDTSGRAISPLITWMDRRVNMPAAGQCISTAELAASRLDSDAFSRTGCHLMPGYMGSTLFWLQQNHLLPNASTTCFITDYLNAFLCGDRTPTDPTMAASSGLFDIQKRQWDQPSIEALGLSKQLLPEVCETGTLLGGLSKEAAHATGLVTGVPVFLGLGDNQASFLGSAGENSQCMLVNIGTGSQVTVLTDQFVSLSPLETRPFLRHGYLLVGAQLTGGRAYALVEQFFRDVGQKFFGVRSDVNLFDMMNELVQSVPEGSHGLECRPDFYGCRNKPEQKAEWHGMTSENFTVAHLSRAVLEGIVQTICEISNLVKKSTGVIPECLVGSGNGLRHNQVLCDMLSSSLGMPLQVSPNREEAAVGAAISGVMAITGEPQIRIDGPSASPIPTTSRLSGSLNPNDPSVAN